MLVVFLVHWLRVATDGVGSPPRGKLYGFCRALVVAFATMVGVGGCHMSVDAAACSGLRRLVLHGNC